MKNVAGVDLKRQFPYTSKEIQWELLLTLGTVFIEKLKEKVGNSFYGILTDEVTGISVTQQLVTFIQYFDRQKCTIDPKFLAVGNTLKGSTSADTKKRRNA